MSEITLYHGSKTIVEAPTLPEVPGSYGIGFVCTEDAVKGRSLASATEAGGNLNIYRLETNGLKKLNLTAKKDGVRALALMADCREFRLFSPEEAEKYRALIAHELPDAAVDLIWAPDISFGLLRAYLRGEISEAALPKAIRGEKRGMLTILKTEKALERMVFMGSGPVGASFAACGDDQLETEMTTLGELAEYVREACKEDLDAFFRVFSISGVAAEWERGNPEICREMSGVEIHHLVMRAIGQCKKTWPKPVEAYTENSVVWIGRMLCYIQRRSGRSFHQILGAISTKEMEKLYEPLKRLTKEQSYDVLRAKIMQGDTKSHIQLCRKRAGLSQRELAERSGVNLRTLQQYEIKDKDINKAAAEKLLAMARVLRCRPEELLEW